MESKLNLNFELVEEARAHASKVADDTQRFIDRHTTVAVERTVCRLLGISPDVSYSDSYLSPGDDTDDLRDAINPKRPPVEALLPRPYYQVFSMKWGFSPNLSIIDLLFNMGNESLLVLYDR